MKVKNNFIIRFNDLKEEIQLKIADEIVASIKEQKELWDELELSYSGDPYDFREDADNYLLGNVSRACDRSWTEWEVETLL